MEPAADPSAPPAQPGVPPLTFTLPDGFREVYPRAGEDDGLMGVLLAATGVEFAAIGLFRIPEGGVAHCTLTIAAVPSGSTRAEVVASGIREVFVRDPLRDTRWLDLPCGPAVAVVSIRAVPAPESPPDAVPPDMPPGEPPLAPGEAAELPIGQIQVHVPFPGEPWIAVFTLETTALDQWDEICELMAATVKSVGFPAQPGDVGDPSDCGVTT